MRSLLVALALLVPAAAAADLFSPGPLAKAHADLEGIRSCTRCHEAGERLSEAKCLGCHEEIAARVARGAGLHGRLAASERACERCHREHQGRDFALIDWGAGGKPGFDHRRTGFALKGAHAKADCGDCHDPRLVVDGVVRRLLTTGKKDSTHLGLGTSCASCHFDEHRGQLGKDCASCHDETKFLPAPKFDHAKTAFALKGKHAKVACARCHEAKEDVTTASSTFPAPRARTFLAYEGVAHGTCADCHADPHRGRFGARCDSCHTEEGWDAIGKVAAKAASFHDQTRFPLTGAHETVACKSCHGPSPGKKAVFRGLAFGKCTDCHADAHVGQLADASGATPGCEACHGPESFSPARFELADHARTKFPLDGAHRAVACAACHPAEPTLATKVPAAVAADLKRRGRPVRVSLARFDRPEAAQGCAGCHLDPHGGQFHDRDCESCHRTTAFSDVSFDHAKSRFALEGAHREVACRTCHVKDARGVIRFKPLETGCAACHADPHAGQFATAGAPVDCGRCHAPAGFQPARVDHAAFPLVGKHETVACGGCHGEVEVAAGVRVVRYRPLPRDCEGCHADPHRGAFQALAAEALAAIRVAEGVADPTTRPAIGAPPGSAAAPAGAAHAGPGLTRCVACHRPTGWTDAAFDHAGTGFPLTGAHAAADCRACHVDGFDRPLSTACATCHQDPHRGDLGMRCEACHTSATWATEFTADAHRRTNFPLVGRHAFLPCGECHPDARDRNFVGPAVPCVSCHLAAYLRTAGGAVDHAAMGFSTECRECHDAWSFERGRFAAHDACFQLAGTEHAGIGCLDCHTSLRSAAPTGTCATGTASCTSCHEHACGRLDEEHDDVPGFQCKDRKCYECHRFSRGH